MFLKRRALTPGCKVLSLCIGVSGAVGSVLIASVLVFWLRRSRTGVKQCVLLVSLSMPYSHEILAGQTT